MDNRPRPEKAGTPKLEVNPHRWLKSLVEQEAKALHGTQKLLGPEWPAFSRCGLIRRPVLIAEPVWFEYHAVEFIVAPSVWVTREGLAMQPLIALVKRAVREVVLGSTPHFGNALAGLVGDPAWQMLLAFRIGYSTHEGLRSPRRAVNEVVKP